MTTRQRRGGSDRLTDLVRTAVESTPLPPRPGRLNPLLRASYGSTAGKSIVGLGLLLLLPLTIIEAVASLQDPGHLLFGIPAALFMLLLFVVPALPARRALAAIRTGVLVSAEIIEMRYRPPGDRTTVNSMKFGFASGRWLIHDPLGAFSANFEVDGPWAQELTIGTMVEVLVEPDRRRVAFALGPPAGGAAAGGRHQPQSL